MGRSFSIVPESYNVITVIRYNVITIEYTMGVEDEMNGVMNMPNDDSKVSRYSRKIGKMGNSLGVSLPKALADQLKVAQGDEIEFIVNEEGDVMLRKVRQTKLPDNVRVEVLEAFYDIFEEDEDILNDLRDR